jgi:transketolase
MRKTFANLLHKEMTNNPNIYLITADLGYGMFDDIKRDFPDRFINCGAAEQLMVGLAIGLSYEGKIPVCYSITPFLLCRPYELLRTYVNHENIPVKLVGGGRGKEYAHDGFSHWADDQEDILGTLKNVVSYVPDDADKMLACFSTFMYDKRPSFLSLSKKILGKL